MTDIKIIDLTPENFASYGVCGYKDIAKHKELRSKMEWFTEFYPQGLRIKAIVSEAGEYQGMLEYIPGELAHRPVNAAGYMFIHCIFIGFRKEFKGKGYASTVLDECIADARKQKMKGVAVVTRKGSFMADSTIFLKKGFSLVDTAKPDFSLLAFKFDSKSPDPSFKAEVLNDSGKYSDGLTIFRSVQCPYTEKNVNAIVDTAKKTFGITAKLIDVNSPTLAQSVPNPFGTFCIVYKGKVISHHPISNTRFENIMNAEGKATAGKK